MAIRFFTKSKKGNTFKLASRISKALDIPALDVTHDLDEEVETLFLVNAMYAANIDKEIKDFIKRNKDHIKEVVNLNTSASGASTYKAVKKECDKYGVKLSSKEFHCRGSWIFINKGFPREEDFLAAEEFVKSFLK